MRSPLLPLACAACLFLFTRPAAHAADLQDLTLEAAVQATLQHNPRLRAALHEAQASDGALRQAGALPNPVLSVEQEDSRRDSRSTTLMLSQTLELGGKREARQLLARRGGELATLALQVERAALRADTWQAFFEALIAQQRVEMAQASVRIAAQGVDVAARRVAAGKVSPTEETRARVAEAGARIEQRQAEAERSAALRALCELMGAGDCALRVQGDAEALPALPDGPVLAERLARAPLLLQARAEAQRAEAGYQLERARAVPDVSVGLGGKRSQELGRTQPLLSLSVPLPLLDRNQGAQLEALRRREAAEARVQAQAQRLRAEVLQAADRLAARLAEVALLRREVLPGAQSAFDAASRGFELGKFGFLDVLDAQRTWLQARSQHLNALAQAHRAAAEIERLLGPGDDDAHGADHSAAHLPGALQ